MISRMLWWVPLICFNSILQCPEIPVWFYIKHINNISWTKFNSVSLLLGFFPPTAEAIAESISFTISAYPNYLFSEVKIILRNWKVSPSGNYFVSNSSSIRQSRILTHCKERKSGSGSKRTQLPITCLYTGQPLALLRLTVLNRYCLCVGPA